MTKKAEKGAENLHKLNKHVMGQKIPAYVK